jgi:3-hydroxyisobutyrate dehydrogenase
MGGAVARRLATGDFQVTVHDPSPDAVRRCVEAGAQASDDLEAAVAGAQVVLTSLPTTALVTETVERLCGLLPGSAVVVDVSTIDAAPARRAADRCAEAGLGFVACALGKAPQHAEQGAIPLFVGGDKSSVEAVTPILDRIGERTYLFKDVEGATTFKLVSNLIGMTNVAVLAEGYALARRAGIDPDMFAEALADTGAASFQSSVRLPWMMAEDWAARFGVDLALNDVSLAVDTAESWHVPHPVSAAARAQLAEASGRGLGREDVVALLKLVTPRAASAAASA